MNSDPHDSAAWRSFGMLDPAELKQFEDAASSDESIREARVEMDRLATALAIATSQPLTPDPEQLGQLQRTLGFHRKPLLKTTAALAGWLLAAILSILLVLHHRNNETSRTPAPQPAPQPASEPAASGQHAAPPDNERLVQEIHDLRQNLAAIRARDEILFSTAPGRSMQVVMILTPPGTPPDELPLFESSQHTSPLAELLGDTLSAAVYSANSPYPANSRTSPPENPNPFPIRTIHEHAQIPETPTPDPPAQPSLLPEHPLAIPIYDPARDAGTLVVSNLPPAGEQGVYNLWVTLEPDSAPVFIGSLPTNSATGADAFDFSLGSSLIPSSFTLTFDAPGTPPPPSASNTILSGPSLTEF